MARVITFSRIFPSYHPRKGDKTYFVEKFWKCLWDMEKSGMNPLDGYFQYYDEAFPVTGDLGENIHHHEAKHHTVRIGNRWKVGEFFSPRVWSGTPYRSKQIQIGPDTEIKKIWHIEMDAEGVFKLNGEYFDVTGGWFAANDGLTADDLLDWFPLGKPFKGQVICWNDEINY